MDLKGVEFAQGGSVFNGAYPSSSSRIWSLHHEIVSLQLGLVGVRRVGES